ncbi:MAG: DUF3461 family protein [Motiliproteus sp.]
MSEYNTLSQMGLTDTGSISHYNLSNEDRQEVLKIYFKRSRGSSLSHSSSFYFDRNSMVSADHEAMRLNHKNSGSDPVLVAAIDELNSLSKAQNGDSRRKVLLNKLELLEQQMAATLRELREDIY